jgi:hypothetical protein
MKVQDKMIKQEDFLNNLFALFDETFDNTRGIYLDKDTSLFRTLETVSSQEASIPVGGKCASLAAQVAHVTFYLEIMEKYFLKQEIGKVDWGYIWHNTEKVTPEEWADSKRKLKDAYQHIETIFKNNEVWDEDAVGGSMAIVVHTAYHLGEIRQALCTLK